MFTKIATVGDNCMDVYDNTGKAYPGGNPVNVAVYFAVGSRRKMRPEGPSFTCGV